MKICSNCKTENKDSANFCRQCGFVFLGIKLSRRDIDGALVGKVNELQRRVSDAETKYDNAEREVNTLNSKVSSLVSNNSNLQSKLSQTEHQLSSANSSVIIERQKAQVAQKEADEAKKAKETAESNGGLHFLYLFIIFVVSIVGIVIFYDKQKKENELSRLSNEKSELISKVNSLNSRNDELKKTNISLSEIMERVSGNIPLIVSSVDIRDASTSFGSTIYSSNTTYLYPHITAFSLVSSSQKVYVKLYTPYGLSTGASSPNGYSFDDIIYPSKNKTESFELQGWGNSIKGNWKPGNYRVEIWCKGKCIGTKSFTIY